MKNICAIFMFLFATSMAHAECITLEEAKGIGRSFLLLEGETTFPYLFANKTDEEKLKIIETLSQRLELYLGDFEQLGYAALAYQETSGDQTYQEFLVVSCKGSASKLEQRQD